MHPNAKWVGLETSAFRGFRLNCFYENTFANEHTLWNHQTVHGRFGCRFDGFLDDDPRTRGHHPSTRKSADSNSKRAGESSTTPDLAVVQLGVTLDDKDAAAAQTQVNEVLQRTLKALRNLKLAENSIKTSGLSLSPVYEQLDRGREPSRPRVVGYRARNIVQVETQDLALVGKILDAALAVGANEIQGVSFQLKDDRESKRAALQRAVAEARTKAETIAEAMGVRLKGVQEVVEGGVHPDPAQDGDCTNAPGGGRSIDTGRAWRRAR